MNFDNIRCFISLAECLNFTRAAKKEHITQTAMSRKISALEKELDVYLVYRDTRQVELTAAGQDFYIRAKEIIHLYDDTVKQVQDIQSDFQSELRIGVGVYDHVLLNQFLGKYVSTLQIKVKSNCIQAPYPTLAKDFEERLIDVMISTDQMEESLLNFDSKNLGMFTIYDEDWYLILHRNNPLAQYDIVPLKELENQTLLSMQPGSVAHVKKFFEKDFLIKDTMFVNSFDSKLVMANANLGVAFAPPFIFPVAGRYQNIVMKKTLPPYHSRCFRTYYWKDNPNPVVLDFISKYQEFCKNKTPKKVSPR